MSIDSAIQPGTVNVPRRIDPEDETRLVHELVSKRYGVELRHESREVIGSTAVLMRNRHHIKHEFSETTGKENRIAVFVKHMGGPKYNNFLVPLEKFLSRRGFVEFLTPLYIGHITFTKQMSNVSLGVWEYLPKTPSQAPGLDWNLFEDQLVLAAAGITVLSDAVRREVPHLRPTIHFVRPVVERIGALIDDGQLYGLEAAFCSERLAKLKTLEQPAIERLKQLGGYLTHNDFRYANLSLSPGQPPVIYDWETASLGPPGATLRVMARLPESRLRKVVELYCSSVAKKGLLVRERDVLFTIRAVEIFRALNYVAKNSGGARPVVVEQLHWAFANAEYLSP